MQSVAVSLHTPLELHSLLPFAVHWRLLATREEAAPPPTRLTRFGSKGWLARLASRSSSKDLLQRTTAVLSASS